MFKRFLAPLLCLALALGWTVPAWAAFGTPTAIGTGFTAASGTQATISPITAGVAATNLVVVSAWWGRSSGTILKVEDSQGNCGAGGYTALTQASDTNNANGRIRLFYCFVTTPLTSGVDTITMTTDASGTNTRLLEAATVSGAAAFDLENTLSTGGTTAPSAPIPATGTFTNSRSIVFSGLHTNTATITAIPTQGGTWTDLGGSVGNNWGFASVVVTSNAQITPTWGVGGATVRAIMGLAAFTEGSPPTASARSRSTLGVGQ